MKKTLREILYEQRQLILMGAFVMMFMMTPLAAMASENDLPWNSALEKLINALSGKTALLVSMVGIFFAGGMLIFGGDLGNFGKMVMMVVLVGSMMGALSSIASKFISTEGALLL
ncbi:MAG: TrbC/VirB2 family protein [Synergistaceae bacterium]|nr:TrbC/VirB2 family protein [Synergistaceae bacterium]